MLRQITNQSGRNRHSAPNALPHMDPIHAIYDDFSAEIERIPALDFGPDDAECITHGYV